MIYVPNLDNNSCYVFQDTMILREYKTTNINSDNQYVDYNTANHYTSISGTEYLTSVPSCINEQDLTSDFYYRNDLSHILVIFFIMFIFIIYIPMKIIFRFYGRGR